MTDTEANGGEARESGGADPVEELRRELEEAKRQAAENLDGWKRTQAELANYRKRVERDAAETRLLAVGRIASRWFPVLDDFDRALKDRPAIDAAATWIGGIELIYRKALAALDQEGIVPLRAERGEAFDPGRHEAVSMEPCADVGDGEVIETLRSGYSLGDRVLRPAQVRVACAVQPPPEAG